MNSNFRLRSSGLMSISGSTDPHTQWHYMRPLTTEILAIGIPNFSRAIAR